jgi:hypothetical protein
MLCLVAKAFNPLDFQLHLFLATKLVPGDPIRPFARRKRDEKRLILTQHLNSFGGNTTLKFLAMGQKWFDDMKSCLPHCFQPLVTIVANPLQFFHNGGGVPTWFELYLSLNLNSDVRQYAATKDEQAKVPFHLVIKQQSWERESSEWYDWGVFLEDATRLIELYIRRLLRLQTNLSVI